MAESNFFCEVSELPVDPARILGEIECPEHGGINIFYGAVRAHNAGKHVAAVGYDAFEPLARVVLGEIVAEARSRWGEGMRVAIQHRTGRLVPGELSVAVGVSSRHRDECYQASRYVIEQLKHRAPIWKKEYYASGETEWLKGHALCQATGSHAQEPETCAGHRHGG